MCFPDTANTLYFCLVPAECAGHGVRHFTNGSAGTGSFNGKRHQIIGASRSCSQRIKGSCYPRLVPAGTNLLQPCNLLGTNVTIVDTADLHLFAAIGAGRRGKAVYAGDLPRTGVNLGLCCRGHFFDSQFWNTSLDGRCHAAKRFNFGHMMTGP